MHTCINFLSYCGYNIENQFTKRKEILLKIVHYLACSAEHAFLAHLSRRLTGEVIVYPCSGVRRCRRRSPFSNNFSSKTAWQIKAKFFVGLPLEGGRKVCINGPGHMPIYGKTFKNLLQNRKSYDLETWYVSSGTQILQSLYKW